MCIALAATSTFGLLKSNDYQTTYAILFYRFHELATTEKWNSKSRLVCSTVAMRERERVDEREFCNV